MNFIEDQIRKEQAEFDKLVAEIRTGQYGNTGAIANLQAFSAKVLSFDLKNLDIRIFELSKKLYDMTDKMIKSNEELTRAQSKHLLWQNILTGALVLATIGLIIASIPAFK